MREIGVYLIRHGESTSNVEFKIFLESITGLLSLQNYSFTNFSRFLLSFWRLTFCYELDSHLSELGKKQAASSASFLQTELSTKEHVIIAHSCLIRAIETAQIMTQSNNPYISLKDLNEANQIEHLIGALVQNRVASFENWLRNSSTESPKSTFVIFGHAQYFKYLLKKSEEMRNCDIWKVTAVINDIDQSIEWKDLKLKCRTPLSYHHPIQVFKEFLFGKSDSDMLSSGVSDQTSPPPQQQESERTCRICQLTSSESPERLIQPCLCRGTISSVHISCLNQWRATSSQASYQCSVCKYRYLVQRTSLSLFCTSDTGVHLLTCLLLLLVILFGGLISFLIFRLFLFDFPLSFSSKYLNWDGFWWRKCSSSPTSTTITPKSYDLLSSWFASSLLWQYQQSVANKYISLKLLNETLVLLCCNSLSTLFIELFYSGVLLVGLFSLLICLVYHGLSLTQLCYHNYQEFQRLHQRNVVVFLIWLASMNNVVLGRYGIIYGLGIVGREVYRFVGVYGRKISQNIGETILEPNSRNDNINTGNN